MLGNCDQLLRQPGRAPATRTGIRPWARASRRLPGLTMRLPARDVRASGLALRSILRLQFADIFVSGSLRPDASAPTIVASNHVCKWDSVIAYYLSSIEGMEFRTFAHPRIMEAYPFMRFFGYVGVPRDDAVAASSVLDEQAGQLANTRARMLWVFAPGQHTRLARDPHAERGALGLRALAPQANFVVVALKYEFFRSTQPWVWLKARSVPKEQRLAGNALTDLLVTTSDELDADLDTGRGQYESRLRRRGTTVCLSTIPVNLRRWNGLLRRRVAKSASFEFHPGDAPPLRYLGSPETLTQALALIEKEDGRLARRVLDEALGS